MLETGEGKDPDWGRIAFGDAEAVNIFFINIISTCGFDFIGFRDLHEAILIHAVRRIVQTFFLRVCLINVHVFGN